MSIATITEDNFEAEVTKPDKPVLVDFWAAWCGPCVKMHPVLEQLSAERQDIRIAKIDIDANQGLANRFNIRSIPTFILVKDGQVIGQTGGARPKNQLSQWIDETLAPKP